MGYLFLYLAITVIGYFIGARLKKHSLAPGWIGPVQTITIILLVFLMGSRIGANEEIVASLDSIGLISFVYTLIIMACTCTAFWLARRALGFDRTGHRNGKPGKGPGVHAGGPGKETGEHAGGPAAASGAELSGPWDRAAAQPAPDASADAAAGTGRPVNTLTFLIVGFVAAGILAGRFLLPDLLIAYTGQLLTVVLCMLLVLIGIDIGLEGTLVVNFRSAGWRVILFPFVSMAAMIVGAVICGAVLPLDLKESLCIGSGFGWYSLAPAMLAEYSTRASAISFMHNVFREIIGILLIPAVARRIGYIESYSLPGSPSMDVCLPVVERATNGDVAVYSFINGAVLSAAVPVLVSLFMNL